ncbi:MAG TPA: UDP-glucose/GDP-mannose dehydrogenase family protein [Dehalococcoidia bacterium]|nr:UDP-glucose/GDP-mannose dehydrogenase family protein [Dehalococcoidia bacterium]
MKISIIGAGYVGLISGACFAKLGHDVVLIDIDADKLATIAKKEDLPIHEEGLQELLEEVHIDTSTDYGKTVDSDVIFVCVGTTADENGNIFSEHLINAANDIAGVLKKQQKYCVVAVKSTVGPGMTESLVIPLLEKSGRKAGKDFGICMSPEFLQEGRGIYHFMNPSRIIIGEYDGRSGDVLERLHQSLKAPVMRASLRTAEMIKLASNAFLATKISFINEIGNICKKLGIDTYEVARGMGLDERIGNKFLNAGIGFGGSCLPKDLRILISGARETGYQPELLREVSNLNENQALKPVELLKKHIKLQGATVGILGLAFKPGTDDIRDSRAIKVAEALLAEGAMVKVYDPLAVANFIKTCPQVLPASKEEVLDSDAVIILTEWEEFMELDYRGKIVIDGRRIEKAREARIYEGVCW